MKPFCIGILMVFLFSATNAIAQTTRYVNGACGDDTWSGASPGCQAPDGPKRTIQAGIAAAQAGDVVEVADGTYTGPGNKVLFYSGRPLTVRSANGPQSCIIDCQGSGVAFWFVADEPAEAVVDGFTITRGFGSLGGAFFCHHDSSPTIRNCILTDNASPVGGAIYCDTTSHPRIERCLITGNRADRGGAIYSSIGGATRATIIDCTITGNLANLEGGAIYCQGISPECINTTIGWNTAGDYGGAVYSMNGDPAIIQCTLVWNTAKISGGAIAAESSNRIAAVRNSILWRNQASSGSELALLDSGGQSGAMVSVSFSTVAGGRAATYVEPASSLLWGSGNVIADPRFVNLSSGDLHLLDGSPCIDAGAVSALPPGVVTDQDGNARLLDDPGVPDTGEGGSPVPDMGAFEFQGTTNRFLLVRPLPGEAGMENSFVVSGASPGGRVFFAAGTRSGMTAVPRCPGLILGIASPLLLGSARADLSGGAVIRLFVPAGARGRTAFLQAVQLAPCQVSDLVPFEFP